jgi:hypothetical protein
MTTPTANMDILEPRTSFTKMSAIVEGGTVWDHEEMKPATTRAAQNTP